MHFPRWFPQVDNVAETVRLPGRVLYSLGYTNCHLFTVCVMCTAIDLLLLASELCNLSFFCKVSNRGDIEIKFFQNND